MTALRLQGLAYAFSSAIDDSTYLQGVLILVDCAALPREGILAAGGKTSGRVWCNMSPVNWRHVLAIAFLLLSGAGPLITLSHAEPAARAGNVDSAAMGNRDNSNSATILTPEEWERVDASVARALRWLALQQQSDGSFPTMATGQPGVTSLCMMAFAAHGHLPGVGPYGRHLERAADYVLKCQKENGLVTLIGPDGPRITRHMDHEIGTCAAYNHAISSLALSEVFGMSSPNQTRRLKAAIDRSLSGHAGNATLAEGRSDGSRRLAIHRRYR